MSGLLFLAAAICGLVGAITAGWILLGLGVVFVIVELVA